MNDSVGLLTKGWSLRLDHTRILTLSDTRALHFLAVFT